MFKIYRYYSDSNINNRCVVVAKFENNKWYFSASRTSKKDRYTKRIGRSIAEGRLLSNKFVKVVNSTNTSPIITEFVEFARQISYEISLTAKVLAD